MYLRAALIVVEKSFIGLNAGDRPLIIRLNSNEPFLISARFKNKS